MSDYIRHHHDRLARIDGIFLMTITNTRAFLKITEVDSTATPGYRDPVLEMPILQLTDDTRIIGLPAVDLSKPYLIPVRSQPNSSLQFDADTSSKELLQITWTLQFL